MTATESQFAVSTLALGNSATVRKKSLAFSFFVSIIIDWAVADGAAVGKEDANPPPATTSAGTPFARVLQHRIDETNPTHLGGMTLLLLAARESAEVATPNISMGSWRRGKYDALPSDDHDVVTWGLNERTRKGKGNARGA